MEGKMKKRIKTILTTALAVTIISTSISFTAFGASQAAYLGTENESAALKISKIAGYDSGTSNEDGGDSRNCILQSR